MDRKQRLLTDLSGDAAAQAAALDTLRLLDLGQVDVLIAALRLCDSDDPVPGDDRGPSDPFAAFFGGDEVAATRTLGEHALDALLRAGLPGFHGIAEALAASLAEPGAGSKRAAAAARLLAETPWDEPARAVEAVLPGLLDLDASLYAVVVVADEPTLEVLIRGATTPFRARLVNELLNHEPARPAALQALADGVTGGTLGGETREALQIVALLFQWGSDLAGPVARQLAARHPWATAFQAMVDPEAAPQLEAWCREGPAAPADLGRLVELVLRHREPLPHYPLEAVLRRLDGAPATIEAQEAVGRCVDLLRDWVRADLRDSPRGWEAAELLARHDLLGGVGPLVVEAIGHGDVPLDPELLEGLAAASQRGSDLPGLDQALAQLAQHHPGALKAILPALLPIASDALLRDTVETLLTAAEDAPVVVAPAGRGLVKRHRPSIDTDALQPAVERLGDPALAARLDVVLPVIGPR